MAAIGVTYSWLKRRSARAKPVSPGLTAGTADLAVPSDRSMWRAKIFSATVMGRLLGLDRRQEDFLLQAAPR